MRALVLVLALGACRSTSGGPYSPSDAAGRDTVRAQELNARAADVIATDSKEAERLLRETLAADIFFGPGHNNLGVLYLKEGKLYEAASEFEWARKLMPGHPDPRVNLALTLERAGRIDEAIESYESAIEVYPDHLPAFQGLCRCQLRHDRADERTTTMLREIALRGETEEWREWARQQLIGRE